jgi:hypothetical protein
VSSSSYDMCPPPHMCKTLVRHRLWALVASIWRRELYPHSPFGLVARLSATHKRAQTVSLTPWYNGRAGMIPFRYSPDLLGGKGTSHVGWDTGDLPSKGKQIRASNPTRPIWLVVVVSCTKLPSQESICASLQVRESERERAREREVLLTIKK